MTKQEKKVLIALKKARTSLDKIIQSLELADSDRKDCFDVVQQNLAVIGLLKSANLSILERHLDEHIGNKSKDKKFKESILKVVKTAQNK